MRTAMPYVSLLTKPFSGVMYMYVSTPYASWSKGGVSVQAQGGHNKYGGRGLVRTVH